MHGLLRTDKGFTLIEALMASVVFMIGFSLLVLLLNGTLVKFSTKELTLGNGLGHEWMIMTLTLADTTALDTTVTWSGTSFRLIRHVEVCDELSKVQVTVSREKDGKEIVQLYNELHLPEKQ